MNESQQQTSHPKPPRHPTIGWMEYVIGGTAVLISAISLQVAVSSNTTQERLLAASTWPYVQYGTGNRLDDGANSITLNLHNAGVGPARIRSVQVFYDGVARAGAGALLKACCEAQGEVRMVVTSDPQRVITAGEEITFMRYDQATANPALWDLLNQRRRDFRVVACYCSVLDDCWTYDSALVEPTPIKQCPAIPEAERWRG